MFTGTRLPARRRLKSSKPMGDLLAAKSFIANQAEILFQIFRVRDSAKRAFLDSFLE